MDIYATIRRFAFDENYCPQERRFACLLYLDNNNRASQIYAPPGNVRNAEVHIAKISRSFR